MMKAKLPIETTLFPPLLPRLPPHLQHGPDPVARHQAARAARHRSHRRLKHGQLVRSYLDR